MSPADPMELIYSLVGYPHETEWIEFKDSNADAVRIGKDISALANAAAWRGREAAYKIWGVEDKTRALLGTRFDPDACKVKGNQELLPWLRIMLTPNAHYEFKRFEHDGKAFVTLTVRAAYDQPVFFQNVAYIREGSNTVPLKVGSAKEAELWRRLQRADFEQRVAADDLTPSEALGMLNEDAYFGLLNVQQPTGPKEALDALCEQDLVRRQDNGRYAITNLGALLVANRLSDFPGLRKRPIRVLRFKGLGGREILSDKTFDEGYAMALQKAEEHILSLVPESEETEGMFRRIRYRYPQRAVRELLSNMVIHQDLSIANQGPLVNIYDNRLEFGNPGESLVQPNRVLNALPRTRNNLLVGILRQMDLCEEGGTGWDLAVAACEDVSMLPPKMMTDADQGTRVTLYAGNAFSLMTRQERLDALYWHACLRYADGEALSNQSLRTRFGLADETKSSLAMSRLIREACDRELIKVEDEDAGKRARRYIPAWA